MAQANVWAICRLRAEFYLTGADRALMRYYEEGRPVLWIELLVLWWVLNVVLLGMVYAANHWGSK